MREICIVPAYDHQQEIESLFSEYTQVLIEGDCSAGKFKWGCRISKH